MERPGSAILALIIGTIITAVELVTDKYPRTFFLLHRNLTLWLYAFIYGMLSFGVVLGLDTLIQSGAIKLEGIGLSSPWVRAIAVGLTAKAFLHVNFFNVRIGSQTLPVGIETIVQLFEPEMLRTILLDEFNAVRNFIDLRKAKYPDLNADKTMIKDNIPRTLADQERTAFENDVDKASSVIEVMELFLRFLGRSTFDRVFPA